MILSVTRTPTDPALADIANPGLRTDTQATVRSSDPARCRSRLGEPCHQQAGDALHPSFVGDMLRARWGPAAGRRWRGGRVAEGDGLLNRYTGITCIVGSNPILSAFERPGSSQGVFSCLHGSAAEPRRRHQAGRNTGRIRFPRNRPSCATPRTCPRGIRLWSSRSRPRNSKAVRSAGHAWSRVPLG